MKRLVLLAPLCLGALTSSAFGAKLSINGTVSSSLQGSDNYFMLPAPSGPTYQWMNSIALDFLAQTPTTRYDLRTNYSYFRYFGPGAKDTTLASGTTPALTFSINHKQELTTYNFSTSWSRQDLAATLLTQTGFATGRGYVDTYSANGGFTRQLTRTDSITWSAKASTVSYSAPGNSPYRDVSTGTTWQHTLSPTTSMNSSVSVDWFSSDDLTKDQRLFWTVLTGMKTQLTHRLSLSGSIGIDLSHTYQNNPGPPGSGFQSGTTNGLVWNASLQYQLLKETSLALTAGQSTTPTVLGDLQKSTSVGLSVSRQINHSSSLSGSLNYSQNQLAGTSSNFFSASANYSYKLTRLMRAHLSYTFQERQQNTGTVHSSTVLLALTRDITLLP